jgi:copper homeostasis protein CutC
MSRASNRKITRDLASSAASLAASDTRSKKSKTTDSTLHRAPTPSLDHKQLDVFRVNLKSLSRAHEYQILRIETHGGALTAEEQRERKVIKSLVIK